MKVGGGTIDLHRREVRWPDGTRADLSETEAALLTYLVSNRERAVSREELLSRVWGIGTAGLETRAVDMHVARLRAKLKTHENGHEPIRSDRDGPGTRVHGGTRPGSPGTGARRESVMTRRLFGTVSGPIAFFLVAALVFAGLGWVTYSALGVEHSQRESAARAELGNNLRVALWQLDSSHAARPRRRGQPALLPLRPSRSRRHTALHRQSGRLDETALPARSREGLDFPAGSRPCHLQPRSRGMGGGQPAQHVLRSGPRYSTISSSPVSCRSHIRPLRDHRPFDSLRFVLACCPAGVR